MRGPQRITTYRRAFRLAAAILSLSALYSCSLLVETRSQQCQDDADCVAFLGARCDKAKGVCVGGTGSGGSGSTGSTSSTSSSTTGSTNSTSASTTASNTSSSSGAPSCDVDGGIDGGGCFSCDPQNDLELLNHCTNGCIPFDDTRVTKLSAGGALPPLPSPGPDGGM